MVFSGIISVGNEIRESLVVSVGVLEFAISSQRSKSSTQRVSPFDTSRIIGE